MKNEVDPNRIFAKLLTLSQKNLSQTLAHQVEHAGYGAILSRLMTGLNIALALEANYFFQINSFYSVEDLFDISVKQSFESASKNQIIAWDFFRDTWNTAPEIRAGHQYPLCPIDGMQRELTRHQWCSVLAYAICGSPKAPLLNAINIFKEKSGWGLYDIHIGLHIRRGDKNTECPYIPTERYLYFLDQVTSKYTEKRIGVFLATDDPSCANDIRSQLDSNIHLIWDADETRYNNYNAQMVANSPDLAFQESLTAAKNICLLGDCDYVIGMATAQFTWIGGLLAIYKNQLDVDRHIMINPFTGQRGHWSTTYGFEYGGANG